MLKKYNAKPEKYLGQHFILSKNALKKMIDAAEIKENNTIIEIGPGLGTLTERLAKIPHHFSKSEGLNIIAVEKDPLMIEILKETMATYKNIKIVQGDVRQILMSDINNIIDVGHQYKVVANLPYNAATFLIRQWLESKNPPQMMVLMIQKEVAQRVAAKPPHSNLLGISVQFYADAEIVDYVKKESFWPKPKVNAAIIKIVPKKMTVSQRSLGKQHFFSIVKAGFSQPRKQLISNLSNKLKVSRKKLILIFKDLNIPDKIRAENLSLNDWQNIASKLIHN